MSENEKGSVDALMRISGAHCASRALHVIADPGIADALGDEPAMADDLAQSTGTQSNALERVLRLPAEYGIFEVRMDSFAPTSSRLLRSDHPQSLRSFVRMMGPSVYWRMWEFFEQSVRTGAAAAAQVMPEGPWQYLQDHPADARIFADAMSAKSHAQMPAILHSYDVSQFSRIADIGGGHSHLLRAVLDRAPNAAGVLFDVSHVVEEAARDSSTRIELQPGNFFTDASPVSDCYLLMQVLHDWNDKRALKILRGILRRAPPNAVPLVIESIIPSESVPTWERILDLHMLAILEGREPTVREYAKLLSTADSAMSRRLTLQRVCAFSKLDPQAERTRDARYSASQGTIPFRRAPASHFRRDRWRLVQEAFIGPGGDRWRHSCLFTAHGMGDGAGRRSRRFSRRLGTEPMRRTCRGSAKTARRSPKSRFRAVPIVYRCCWRRLTNLSSSWDIVSAGQ